jgi:hypothetical protein
MINLVSAVYEYNPKQKKYVLKKRSVKINPNLKQDVEDLEKEVNEK